MFLTELDLVQLSDRAAIVHPHHFLLWTDHPTIEVGRPNNKLDLHWLPEFFGDFPTHGLITYIRKRSKRRQSATQRECSRNRLLRSQVELESRGLTQ